MDNGIQSAFDTTVKSTDLQELASGIAEASIDTLLDNGFLKELPVVGSMIALGRFGANVRDRLFLKKVLTFLNQLKDIPVEQRKKLIEEIDDSKQYRVKVGEKLLYIIDTCGDYEVSELIGILFKAYLQERISYDDFIKASAVLGRLTISDFKWFTENITTSWIDLDKASDLIHTGVFELHYEDIHVQVNDEKDHKQLLEGKKYDTDVDGGVNAVLSRAGEVILEVFSTKYEKPRQYDVRPKP